ncbi:hypothetical protein GALL_462600 [mine drainage metagenome]|uniref:Uncharacterized protein n=1 Tax=mine drainage metagenome TaxID=410659 RepID=A0A1J5Q849_9ZZZZ
MSINFNAAHNPFHFLRHPKAKAKNYQYGAIAQCDLLFAVFIKKNNNQGNKPNDSGSGSKCREQPGVHVLPVYILENTGNRYCYRFALNNNIVNKRKKKKCVNG